MVPEKEEIIFTIDKPFAPFPIRGKHWENNGAGENKGIRPPIFAILLGQNVAGEDIAFLLYRFSNSCYDPKMKSLLLMALSAISSFGQILPKCDVALNNMPALQGVRLRMPESEVLKLPVVLKPPRSSNNTRVFEAVERVQIPGSKERPAFYVQTYDQKVLSLVVYDAEISGNIYEFVKGLSNSLTLPLAPWFKHSDSRIISCPEFEITVNPTPNLLTLLDLPAFRKVTRDNETEKQKLSKP